MGNSQNSCVNHRPHHNHFSTSPTENYNKLLLESPNSEQEQKLLFQNHIITLLDIYMKVSKNKMHLLSTIKPLESNFEIINNRDEIFPSFHGDVDFTYKLLSQNGKRFKKWSTNMTMAECVNNLLSIFRYDTYRYNYIFNGRFPNYHPHNNSSYLSFPYVISSTSPNNLKMEHFMFILNKHDYDLLISSTT
jgi:hypothetical protein